MSVILDLYKKYEEVFNENLFAGDSSVDMNRFIFAFYPPPLISNNKWNFIAKWVYRWDLISFDYRVALTLTMLDLRFSWETLIVDPNPVRRKMGRLLYLTKSLTFHEKLNTVIAQGTI